MTGSELTGEEVAALRRLLEIEKIRKLVQLYSHHMDGRDFAAMAGLYAEDARCEWGPYGNPCGREAIHRALVDGHPGRAAYDGFHITTNLWIELTGEDTAVSRNYLTDVWPATERGPICHDGWPDNPVILYAVYENDYVREAGAWLIARSAIQFVWPSRVVSPEFPRAMTATAIG